MSEDTLYPEFKSPEFVRACRDYYYLVDRLFPERGVLKLVGDRYRLSGDQRTVLYRGISSGMRSELRSDLLVTSVGQKYLIIDGYNVLFTLLNYRMGKITFISTDHMVRDAGSLHGKLRDERTFASCIGLLIDFLNSDPPEKTEVYLDSPVSHSVRHAQWIRDGLKNKGLEGDCYVIHSADWALRHAVTGVLATSDTGIIEKARLPVIDLPRFILEQAYRPAFPDLSRLLSAEEV